MITNIVLLALSIQANNDAFPYGATDEDTGWGQQYCWVASITYAAPAGVFSVFHTADVEGQRILTNSSGATNGAIGMRWEELNNSLRITPTGYTNYRGRYTNAVEGTNTISFPIPPFPNQFFRMKQLI